MTRLDTKAREAAYTAWDAFDGTSTRYQIDDAITAYLDALSSLPAQAVGVKARCTSETCQRRDGITCPDDECDIEAALAPSQPTAVGVTDEMVEQALDAELQNGETIQTYLSFNEADGAEIGAIEAPTSLDIVRAMWLRHCCEIVVRNALEAALRSTP